MFCQSGGSDFFLSHSRTLETNSCNEIKQSAEQLKRIIAVGGAAKLAPIGVYGIIQHLSLKGLAVAGAKMNRMPYAACPSRYEAYFTIEKGRTCNTDHVLERQK